jgi:N-acetylmuramoyl-L-alanine amidase
MLLLRTDHASPSYDTRSLPISLVVLHYTGMKSGAAALSRLCDPTAKVSAHYCIEVTGEVYALVPEYARAWHAGVSLWRGIADVNSASIGIELVNRGHDLDYPDFPGVQIHALTDLLADLFNRYAFMPEAVIGHSDVAPTRKVDPGEKFPWQTLAALGFGVWPKVPPSHDHTPLRGQEEADFIHTLMRLGYDVDNPEAATQAFYRHYLPDHLGRPPTRAALGVATDLLSQRKGHPL